MSSALQIEQNEAKRDGAIPVKNSGRGMVKCDAVLGNFGVDYKHVNKSFTINKEIWAKICGDAFSNGRRQPAVKIVLGGIDEDKTRLWLVEDEVIKEYLDLQEKYEDLLMDYNNVIRCTYE